MTAVELRNVAKSYDGRCVLNQFSLCAAGGERLVLYGPSGCGKTTVLRILAGFAAPDEGVVLLGERIVAEHGIIRVPPAERDVGMVFQDLALWPHLTVARNLEFGLRARGVPKAVRTARITEMLERVRLADWAVQYPTRLSGGQQQRVAIARAMINNPPLLFADEPTGNLDSRTSEELLQMFQKLNAEEGITIILVTHDPEVASHAKRLIHIKDGLIDNGSSPVVKGENNQPGAQATGQQEALATGVRTHYSPLRRST
jgi:ABC-type Fe3+/spermidine/putrescine transport system ATPase subunit